MAFQYFDVYVDIFCLHRIIFDILCHSDNSGTITYEEFKNVFSANVGPDSIPFDFDWLVDLGQ